MNQQNDKIDAVEAHVQKDDKTKKKKAKAEKQLAKQEIPTNQENAQNELDPLKNQVLPKKVRPPKMSVPKTTLSKSGRSFIGKWGKFSKFKSFIEGTSIIPIKAPVSKEINASLPIEKKFFLEEVLEFAANQGKPIACIISLANSLKFYDPNLLSKEIEFCHCPIAGQSRPSAKLLTQILDKLTEYDEKGKGIAIHCTHGINRTGFIVCKYLVEKKGLQVEEAIQLFETCRGEKIERDVYLDELKSPAENQITEKSQQSTLETTVSQKATSKNAESIDTEASNTKEESKEAL